MPLFQQNRPDHSILLMPVRLGNERLPRNKVRMLSCDARGKLFTRLIGSSTYQRIKSETQKLDESSHNYATVYWNTSANNYKPMFVKIGDNESWALGCILEHALKSGMIPDILKRYPGEIIKLGEDREQKIGIPRTKGIRKTKPSETPKVLERLPYYSEQDVEVSVPIYKAEYTFPLIILKRLPDEEDTPTYQKRLLVLDSDGDITITMLPVEQIDKAETKLGTLRAEGGEGYLICLQDHTGISIDILAMSDMQKQALETVTQRYEETGAGKQHLPEDVINLLDKVKETA